MWSAVILRILDHGSTRSPGHASMSGSTAPGAESGDGEHSAPRPGRARCSQDVLLRHTARQTAARNARDVHAVLGCDLADEGRGFGAQPLLSGLNTTTVAVAALHCWGWCRGRRRFGRLGLARGGAGAAAALETSAVRASREQRPQSGTHWICAFSLELLPASGRPVVVVMYGERWSRRKIWSAGGVFTRYHTDDVL